MAMIAITFYFSLVHIFCSASANTQLVADAFHTLDKDLNGYIDASELPPTFSSNALGFPSNYIESLLSVIQRETRINYETAIALVPVSSSIPSREKFMLRMRGGDTIQPSKFSKLLIGKSCPSNLPTIDTLCLMPNITCNYYSGQCCCPRNSTCTSTRTSDSITCDKATMKWAFPLASGVMCPECIGTPIPPSGCPATFMGNTTLPCTEGANCNYEVGACCCPLGSVQQGKTCADTITSQRQQCTNRNWEAISGISQCAPCSV